MGCLPEAVVVDTGDAFVYVWKTNEILSLYHTKKKDPASLEKNNITIFQKRIQSVPFVLGTSSYPGTSATLLPSATPNALKIASHLW